MDVVSNGTVLYAEATGDGPPLVLVHGMCGDARVWSDQVQRLQDRFRCVAYDRRGHTRSPRTDEVETVQLHADDLAGLVESLELAPCYVVGSSGGARVIVDLIRRYPALVRAAVVSEPPLGSVDPDGFADLARRIGPRIERAVAAGEPRAAVDGFFEEACPGLWIALDEPTRDRYRDNADLLFADLGMPRYEIDESAAAGIDVPTLVITGTRSLPVFRTVARTLAGWLPRSELVELDCGHVTYAERPAEFAAAVEAFLSRY